MIALSGTIAAVSVSINPLSQNVLTGNTSPFTASVLYGTSNAVVWTVAGGGCGGHPCGSISSAGSV